MWLAIALVTLAAVTSALVALVRHAMVVGRAARRLAQEVGAVQADLEDLRTRATRAGGSRR
ncbi:hypothetical protein HRbin12_00963 [bacterium HR12]|nr:hypothetical protein HRbin12_00963 [bacterium HR12]